MPFTEIEAVPEHLQISYTIGSILEPMVYVKLLGVSSLIVDETVTVN